MRKLPIAILLLLVFAWMLVACSTTKLLGDGEVLYTGVKKVQYNNLDTVKIESDVKDQIFSAINYKPNNPLYSPYIRNPFPIGLWVYNHWYTTTNENGKVTKIKEDSLKKIKGFKSWLYKALVAKPVLISNVRPQTRVTMIDELLHDNGYFGSKSSYSLEYSKNNPKKAKISYNIDLHKPYTLGKITYLEDSAHIDAIDRSIKSKKFNFSKSYSTDSLIYFYIDSTAYISKYFKTGSRYCADSLNTVRINIANELRNRGYYYFRPEYIEYLADSVSQKGVINIQMVKTSDIPEHAFTRFVTGNDTVFVENFTGRGVPDTVKSRFCIIVKKQPVHISDRLISSCIRGLKGRPFRVGNMDVIQMNLARTGIFSSVNIETVPKDSTDSIGNRFMDLRIYCTLDKPIEVKVEAQGTTKSNSFIGPGIGVGIKHKNIFGGAEQLSADLTGSYEWQTGKGGAYKNSDFNSYEVGLDVSLAIPRLLAPRFIDRTRRYLNWTRFTVGGEFLNRPNFFKMARMSAEMTWEWHARKYSQHRFTPFKLTYSNLLSTTAAFDSAYFFNRAVKQAFEDVFIPQMIYSYTLDRTFGKNNIVWNITATEAGNLAYCLWRAFGVKSGEMHIMNTYFSQFLKVQTQVVWTRSFLNEHKLVGRLLVGAAHAYGNFDEVPYMEQFYIGGSNSLRGFSVRSVGPGSYHQEYENALSYYDQTGTFKLETNLEYRFPLLGYLKGAVFLDAGNVWLLKDDEFRPGGKLTGKNFFNEIALNTGLGVRFDMSMIVLRADLGIALHAPYDTGQRGYFNIPRFKDSLAFHIAIGYPF
ncbi:MAG: BamA/TamA family outer membrane protein [Muribaculaceae bacterium]|nr:BamA/TamA family outer membrane protein [Muribaculaceae bacterium]